ncbi:MAG: ORF6N domain-containing protein [Paludibacteraceae bacterium]|nr:ORF6N domain-containing protein [Paludibacteraceae bacterium]
MTNEVVKYEEVKDRIIVLRGEPVLLDADVAQLYGVETKRVNEAVKNNPDKFPEGFLFSLNDEEKTEVVENFDHLQKLKFSPVNPTAFTESGLYMLATILKSPRATQTTLAIIKTFVQLREVARTMQAVATTEDEKEKKSLMQKSGELIGNVIGAQFETVGTETEVELNFAVVKIRHKVIRGNKDEK